MVTAWPTAAGGPGGPDTRGRTIVVAASNSVDPTLAPVAYRCDGVADQVEINAAIAALGAVGGAVILLEGTYNTTASITITRNNVALMGEGWGTLIDVAGAGVNGVVVGNGATAYRNIIIQDLQIDGTGTAANGVYVWGAAGNEVRDVTIQRCYVHHFDNNVRLTRTRYSTVAQNTLINATGTANSTGIYATYVDYLEIWANICVDNDAWGINIVSATYCRVTENLCYSQTWDDGIRIVGSRCVVSDNQCLENAFSGIKADTLYDSVISGNMCNDNTQNGIQLSTSARNTVTGNLCYSNDQDGLDIASSSNDNAVVGNSFSYNAGRGVDIVAYCERNLIKENEYISNTTAAIRDQSTTTRLAEVHVDVWDHTAAAVGNVGDFVSVVLADAADVTVRFNLRVPSDFHELVRARVVVVPLGTGNMRRGVETDFGACSEVYNTHTDSIAAGQVAVTVNQLTCLDVNDAFTGIAAGDHVGVAFTRYGSNALDTVDANVHVVDFWMQYV